ncbi:type IV pilus modification protein PilV [Pseudomonadota bacterium]
MRRAKHQQSGVTLIEVLISLVVLSVGLLGIAGMQATGMRNNHAAYSKMQATNMAMDMADRIRSNPEAIDEYKKFDSTDSSTFPEKEGDLPSCTANTDHNGCSTTDLAKADMYEWAQPIISSSTPIIPGGSATISTDNDTVTISLYWREPHFEITQLDKCNIKVPDQIDATYASDKYMACIELSFIP